MNFDVPVFLIFERKESINYTILTVLKTPTMYITLFAV